MRATPNSGDAAKALDYAWDDSGVARSANFQSLSPCSHAQSEATIYSPV
jgi:hypothetical protein